MGSPVHYPDYIASPAWRRRRACALRLAGWRCQYEHHHDEPGRAIERCDRRRNLEVHHLTYDRLGCEADADLEALCWFHHAIEHLMERHNGCRGCGGPIFPVYAAASAWLDRYLIGLGVDPDRDRRYRLPHKFAIEAAVPPLCAACAGKG